jgi:hypothetical protein
MSIFALTALGGIGLGPVYSGWIEMNPKLEWKWIQWIHMMQVILRWLKKGRLTMFSQLSISAVYLLLLPFVMKETRSSILLTRIAKNLRKTTGNHQYRAKVEDERTSLGTLIFISCTRPVRKLPFNRLINLRLKYQYSGLLCTEPVVFGVSVSSLADFL